MAWPRWLIGSFSSGRQLAVGAGLPVGHEDRVVAEPSLPRGSRTSRPGIRPSKVNSRPSGRTSAATQTNAAARWRSSMSAIWASSELDVGAVVAVPARPAGAEDAGHAGEQVDREPGVVADGGQAGVPDPLAGLEQRVLGEGEPGLGHVVVGGHVVEPDHVDRTAGPATSRMRRSSASFLALRVATSSLRAPGRASGRPLVSVGQRAEQPATARSSRALSSSREKTPASPVPCTSTKSPVPVQTTFMSTSALTSSS